MSKQRLVDTFFWDDTYVVGLDPLEKLLFLYLLTSPHSNISGVYEVSKRALVYHTGLSEESLTVMLQRLERDGKILYLNSWVAIKNFIKHQATGSVQVCQGILRELARVPPSLAEWVDISPLSGSPPPDPRKRSVSKYKRQRILDRDGEKCRVCGTETGPFEIDHVVPVSEGGHSDDDNLRVLCQSCNGRRNAERARRLQNDFDTARVEYRDATLLNLTKPNSTKPSGSVYPVEFEEWWKAYPRKVEKRGAWKKWEHARKVSGHGPLLTAAVNYARYVVAQRTEAKFVKHAATFLGPSEPWRDWLVERKDKVETSAKAAARGWECPGCHHLNTHTGVMCENCHEEHPGVRKGAP